MTVSLSLSNRAVLWRCVLRHRWSSNNAGLGGRTAQHVCKPATSTLRTFSALPLPDRRQPWQQHQAMHPKQPFPDVEGDHAAEAETDTSANDPEEQPSTLTYTGGVTMPITCELHIAKPGEDAPRGIWPVFRLMDENGRFRHPTNRPAPTTSPFGLPKSDECNLDHLRDHLRAIYPAHAAQIDSSTLLRPAQYPYNDTQSTNTLLRAYRQMVRLREMDNILLNAQRQGRISFYMTCRGEEAIHMGAAAALQLADPVFAQYREQGLLMWRGFTLEQFTNQCFSNDMDLGKGRQMPVHYGSRALNYHTVSSPLGTQLPQAAGAAYRLKMMGEPAVAACFFGDGCSSTTDFHSALNFAATLESPVLFICRNNGFAISTSVEEQYRGDGVVSRAPGYGMAAIRVDGNDVFAVEAAVREARTYAIEHSAPVLIEAMTYRQGHHSTSDDSTRYRSKDEVNHFAHNFDPVTRLDAFLAHHHWMDKEQAATMWDDEKLAVLKAMQAAEKRPKPSLECLFEDVYHRMPPHLQEQQAQLRQHIAKYPNRYK